MVSFKVERVEEATGRKTLDVYFCKVYEGTKDITKEYCEKWGRDCHEDGTVSIYVDKGREIAAVLKDLTEITEKYSTRKEYLKSL